MADGARGPARAAGLAPDIVPLLREIGDTKRVRAAHLEGSVAADAFLSGWARLMAGEAFEAVAAEALAEGVAAARLGAIGPERLTALGLSEAEAVSVLARTIEEVGGALPGRLKAEVTGALPRLFSDRPALGEPPAFARALARQPRAGVTCPGRARIMLQPEENHAEHCQVVAVYAGLLAPAFGADPALAWWYGMVHHLHSAAMPDAGFTGEMLLEPHLTRVIGEARRQAMAALTPALSEEAEAAFAALDTDDTPAARAFHAADVIDRVLEIDHHLARSAVTMDTVLGEYELVHDGPVKGFHDEVLQAVRLPR